jgi:hypothetical protein
MGSTVFESELFRDMFGTAEMRAIKLDATCAMGHVPKERV